MIYLLPTQPMQLTPICLTRQTPAQAGGMQMNPKSWTEGAQPGTGDTEAQNIRESSKVVWGTAKTRVEGASLWDI